MSTHTYLIALGSNMRVPGIGLPREVLRTAFAALADLGEALAASPIIDSAPVGPSQRTYANAAAVIESEFAPPAMMRALLGIESEFGRERRSQSQGQRWRARALDLDIVLWSGGIWASERLSIPHTAFRNRAFVLGPAAAIAGDWRDPISSFSLAQLNARLTRPRGLLRGALRSASTN
ncbi:MAG: 2-amino-4-hydroxy-6-hydroxymethyldihydropteridine diphosphokinase [Pseudomonadota bacterium]